MYGWGVRKGVEGGDQGQARLVAGQFSTASRVTASQSARAARLQSKTESCPAPPHVSSACNTMSAHKADPCPTHSQHTYLGVAGAERLRDRLRLRQGCAAAAAGRLRLALRERRGVLLQRARINGAGGCVVGSSARGAGKQWGRGRGIQWQPRARERERGEAAARHFRRAQGGDDDDGGGTSASQAISAPT